MKIKVKSLNHSLTSTYRKKYDFMIGNIYDAKKTTIIDDWYIVALSPINVVLINEHDCEIVKEESHTIKITLTTNGTCYPEYTVEHSIDISNKLMITMLTNVLHDLKTRS